MKLLESGYIQQKIVDIDGNKFLVPTFVLPDSDPAKISSIGSKLTCESLSEVLDQQVEKNKYFGDVRSVVSKRGTYVDCYEPKTNIILDYLSQDYYKYEGPDYKNLDVYDFYNRMAINESKKEKLFAKKNNYFEVPYMIDICKEVDGKTICDKNTDHNLRKQRIKSYLREKIATLI
tara:strand:- start:35237 stop:35764 length:528 start_codon:yes stop_codon:yes gene_type:complete